MARQEVIQALLKRGVPEFMAQGIASEIDRESGFDPTINEKNPLVPGSRGGFGLFQHTGPRRVDLEAFAQENGVPVDAIQTQVDFALQELQTTEKRAGDALAATTTAEDAASVFKNQFLRPASTQKKVAELKLPAAVLTAFENNKLSPKNMQRVQDLLDAQQPPAAPKELSPSILDAFRAGTLTPENMIKVQDFLDVQQPTQPEQPAQQNIAGSFGDGVLRQIGLTARAGAEGTAGLIGIAYDPIAALLNIVLDDASKIPPLRENVSRLLTDAGVPNPQNITERIVQQASQALVGGGGIISAARGASRALVGPVSRGVVDILAQSPSAQLAASAASGGAGQAAKESGAGPVGQTVAAFGGGLAAAGGLALAGRRAVTRPSARTEPPITAAQNAAQSVAPVTDDVALDVGRTVALAAKGNNAARTKLAALAQVNPEAAAAANRLGIDLPPDVFSDNVMLQSAAGLARSQAGGSAEAAWVNSVRAAADRADQTVSNLGATKDVSKISQDVFDSLKATRQKLTDTARELYEKVDKAIKNPTVIGTPNLNKALTGILQDVGETGLSTAESNLFKAATSPGGMTYGRLIREKSLIGKAIGRGNGPYADVEQSALKRLYGALADDQMTAAQTIGGEDVSGALTVANGLTAKQKTLEKSIIAAFGSDLEGSIARRLETAISQAGKGDVGNLNRILNVIPKDLRAESILTGIMSATKSKSAASVLPPGSFGFAEYAKFYSSLRQNSKAFNAIAKNLNPKVIKTLGDLFAVSQRITAARGKVLSTGKSNQALVQGMTGENIFGRIIGTSTGQIAASGAGALGGGPFGAMAAQGIVKALASGKSDPLIAAGKLFRDDKFMKMMETASTTGNASPGAINAAAKSTAFQQWAKTAGITEPKAWLINTVAQSAKLQTEDNPK